MTDGILVAGNDIVYTPSSTIYDAATGGNKNISSAAYIRVSANYENGIPTGEWILTINEEIA